MEQSSGDRQVFESAVARKRDHPSQLRTCLLTEITLSVSYLDYRVFWGLCSPHNFQSQLKSFHSRFIPSGLISRRLHEVAHAWRYPKSIPRSVFQMPGLPAAYGSSASREKMRLAGLQECGRISRGSSRMLKKNVAHFMIFLRVKPVWWCSIAGKLCHVPYPPPSPVEFYSL